ncbi:family 1 glycosylhydrolase [Nocardia seriolae]|uniref:family 1 glycosylhydrolase n=1 Tax=Nocardia seriolae TaxID=37332 RepID=UPI0012BB9455|nr:family 1 glycosylhydrolase [Nocardia seriolae]MTK33213.1 family 1 glycosylhydrolase [Nocardia seriolae]MTK40593.1 family 1 glycosylhydrolase [Nocardia seriolae]
MRTRFRCVSVTGLVLAAILLLVPGAARTAPEWRAGVLGSGFLWGVAASGFQSEGQSPDSNWTRYIEANAGWDRLGDSVDFRDRFRSDIDSAAQLGVRVFRIGLEWARLEPTPGVWDPAAFAFYDKVVDAIVAAGMRPMLTLDHWVYPGWEVDRGGWGAPGMVADWLANMRKVVDHFAGRDPIWVTVNEPVAYIMHEVRQNGTDADRMLYRVAQAHNGIYDYIHRVQPNAWVTSNVGYVAGAESQVNGPLLDLIGDRLDFVGVDYYFGYEPPELAALTAPAGMWDLPVRPEGIYYALQHYSRRFPGKPLWIVENGMPTENGRPRADGYTRSEHLRDTVYWLQRAKADGMNVIGYNYWSLTDNYEWSSYTTRFGLYTVNVRTDPALTRVPTDAVDTYHAIIAANGVPADYRPFRTPAACELVDPPASCDTPITAP